MRIRRLHPSEFQEGSNVLARAFHADPLQTYVFPDTDQRAALSPLHFEPLLKYGHLAGEVWTTEESVQGVAVWWPPEHKSIDQDLLEKAGFNGLPAAIGADAFERFMAVLGYLEPFHLRDVPRPHWYAMVIGVDPSRQGRGIGGSFLEPILARADAAGVDCYLETCQPRNVVFYQRHGFEILVEGVEPASGLRYWTFRRQPLA